jgi:hypothetical protein
MPCNSWGENLEQREHAFERRGPFASTIFVCTLDGDKRQATARILRRRAADKTGLVP